MVALLEGRRLLALARLAQRFVLLLRTQLHFPTAGSGTGADGARRTDLTIRGAELDVDHVVVEAVLLRQPLATRLPTRARHLLCFPIDGERRGIKTLTGDGLPTASRATGPSNSMP